MSQKGRVGLICFGGFLLALHYALVVYVNSSLLKQFFSDSSVSILYVLGSLGSIITLLYAPFFIKKYGNALTLLSFITLEAISVFGIGSTSLAFAIAILFTIHQAAESILYFALDVQLEHETTLEGTTGKRRGIFFTVQNIAWVSAPLLVSVLAAHNDFANVYYLSGLALVPFFFVTLKFKNIKPVRKNDGRIISGLKTLLRWGDRARIVMIQAILNFFYAWMVIYLPLLLNQEVGFGWDKIGLLFTIMLLPFLLFELPAGFIADKKTGEKEILVLGLVVMACTTFFIPFINSAAFAVWAVVLFGTRVGASLVEIGAETYFFKHVKDSDTTLISLFRMVRPITLLIAPLIALPVLSVVDYGSSFAFLAVVVALGLLFIPKVDTK